jgi:hypothetical protein
MALSENINGLFDQPIEDDLFVEPLYYPWQVAPQQSLFPFIQTQQK